MALAEDLQGRLEELVGLANSTDGIGNYLFSGYQGKTQPFIKSHGHIQYAADDGQRFVQVDKSRQLATSDSGADIFMRIKNGNGKFSVEASNRNQGSGITSQGVVTNPQWLTGHDYKLNFAVRDVDGEQQSTYDIIDLTAGCVLSEGNRYVSGDAINFDGMQLEISGDPADCDEFYVTRSENESVFKTMSDLISALKSGNPLGGSAAAAQYTNSINRALNNLDRGLQNVSTIRTSLGSRLREIDALQVTGEDLGLQYKAKLSELQDVDFNKAVTDLNLQQTSLTAAQKTFKQVSDMSLFNYL
jgi:flagellar hook-associated protein 3 FlgL